MAQVANEANARFILVSAFVVDRPDLKLFQISNTLGGYVNSIRDAKPRGEEKTRATLKDYVRVPTRVLMGGEFPTLALLTWNSTRGTVSGVGLSKDTLTEVVVAALGRNVRGATVKTYQVATTTLLKPEFDKTGGNKCGAVTYAELFVTGASL